MPSQNRLRHDWRRAVVLAMLGTGVIGAGLESPAMAQASPAAESAGGLEEVVVTANRRQENNQSVPIAVSAITPEQVSALGITDIDTLGENIPGAVFQRQSNGSIPFLRGVGNPNSTAGDEPSVATYVDGVYMPFPGAGVSNYNTIDGIEVAKGPQGTLFGRNATGGVIQIHTKDPSRTPEVDVTAGYANYDTLSQSVYATGGLTSQLSGNIAGYWSRQSDGWGRNLVTGSPSFINHDEGGRIKLLWTPTDRTTVLLALDHDETDLQQGINYRGAPGTLTQGGFPAPAGYYDYYSPFNDDGTLYTTGVMLKATQDYGWANLIDITSWRTSQNPAYYNLALGPSGLGVEAVDIIGKDQTFTEELRLESPSSGAFRWTAGVYWFHDNAAYDPLNINVGFAGLDLNHVGKQWTNSYALYADTTTTIASTTHVTVGIRGTTSHRAGANQFAVNGNEIKAAEGYGAATFNSLTGRFILDHQFTDEIMGYVAYNRGYKDGLFNLAAVGSPIPAPVSPETIDDYSFGEKAEFLDHRLRINTEAFYYSYKNIQVQEVVNNASFTSNAAAATIKGVDLDITAKPVPQLTVTGSFEYLDGKFGDFPGGAYNVYQPLAGGNCAFTGLGAGLCGLAPGSPYLPPNFNPATATWNLAGNKTPNSPPFSMSLSGTYDLPTSVGTFTATAAWHHTNLYYFQADNGRGQQPPSSPLNGAQPALDLVDGSVGWDSNQGIWHVKLWAKNITNVEYSDFTFETGTATQISAAPPRTYGITVSASFK
jgi:iron complex outermembrane recepter protein